MKIIDFRGIEDLTEENMKLFEEGLKEIEERYRHTEALLESKTPSPFDSVEQYMEYYDAIPWEDFDKKIRSEVDDDNK